MGLQYDNIDSAPSTNAQMSSLQSFTTGPVWSGYQAAPLLSKIGATCPVGSIVVDVDVTRFSQPWYSYITAGSFVAQSNIAVSLANMFSPSRLIIATDGGSAVSPGTPVGKLYVSYTIELIEPEAATVNL
jgi:hypothetical protein